MACRKCSGTTSRSTTGRATGCSPARASCQPRIAPAGPGVRHAKGVGRRRPHQARRREETCPRQPRSPPRLGIRRGLRPRDVADASAADGGRLRSWRPARATPSATLVEVAFGHAGLDWKQHVEVDPSSCGRRRSTTLIRQRRQGAPDSRLGAFRRLRRPGRHDGRQDIERLSGIKPIQAPLEVSHESARSRQEQGLQSRHHRVWATWASRSRWSWRSAGSRHGRFDVDEMEGGRTERPAQLIPDVKDRGPCEGGVVRALHGDDRACPSARGHGCIDIRRADPPAPRPRTRTCPTSVQAVGAVRKPPEEGPARQPRVDPPTRGRPNELVKPIARRRPQGGPGFLPRVFAPTCGFRQSAVP